VPYASSSSIVEDRDRPGSSRTKYHVPRFTAPSSPTATLQSSRQATQEISSASLIDLDDDEPETAPSMGEERLIDLGENTEVDMDAPHARYRSPEAVIEPEEAPPGYVIAEHPYNDDDSLTPPVSPIRTTKNSSFDISDWQQHPLEYDPMDIDQQSFSAPDRPSIGPGVLPLRMLRLIHDHDLRQPKINKLPQVNPAKSHASATSISEAPRSPEASMGALNGASASLVSLQTANDSVYDHVATESDVMNAIPGGEHDSQHWYFCTTCWGWMRVTAGHGDPDVPTMEEWEQMVDNPEEKRQARFAEWAKYNDLKQFRLYNTQTHHHMHSFEHLAVSNHGHGRIERIPVDDEVNAFPHVALSFEQPESWSSHEVPHTSATLYISSASDLWISVEAMIPGQLPVGLVNDFTKEKSGNPNPGQTGAQSIAGAWTLMST
jgi:ubiquitin carboxyl-terminal hydrolase 25/28